MFFDKKRVLIVGLVILLLFTLTGCFWEKEDDDLVWDTYSNEYFSFKYPSNWSKIDEDIEDEDPLNFINVAYGVDVNSLDLTTGKVAFNVDYYLEPDENDPSNENEFYVYMEERKSIFDSKDYITLESNGETTLDGYSAYKFIYTAEATADNDYAQDVKVTLIFYYHNNIEDNVMYVAKPDKYSQSMADEIINSVDFKTNNE